MQIIFLTTGGTIDKDYAPSAGTYNFEIAEPAVKRILERINPNFSYEIISLCKKDSLDLTDDDRNLILEKCKQIKNTRIIITHGTDTMVQTGKKLKEIKDKSIILVGSSKPEKFKDTDADFNLGIAIGAIQTLPTGVYIAMNGRISALDKIQKEQTTGKFIEI